MLRALTTAALAAIAVAASSVGEARSLRSNGAPHECSLFDKQPCMPTFCSVFDPHPCVPDVQYPIGQDLRLTIESDPSPKSSEQYKMPDHDLNTIGDLFASLRACWQPPALSDAREGTQMSVRFSFNRDGKLIAPPRLTYVSKDTPSDARQLYRDSIDASFDRCAPLHFTRGLGGAIAGRPIAVRYVENRSKEGPKTP